jgi:hypothetical protein
MVHIRWVKSHHDNTSGQSKLSIAAALNVKADQLASEFLKQHSVRIPRLEGRKARLSILKPFGEWIQDPQLHWSANAGGAYPGNKVSNLLQSQTLLKRGTLPKY